MIDPNIPTISTVRGSYVLWLEDPTLVVSPRYVHFSWGAPNIQNPMSFKLRDYIDGKLWYHPGGKKQSEDNFTIIQECPFNRDEVWAKAKKYKKAVKDLRMAVENFSWWQEKLNNM